MGRFRSNSTNLTPIKYIALSDIYLNLILRADGYLSDSTPSELIVLAFHITDVLDPHADVSLATSEKVTYHVMSGLKGTFHKHKKGTFQSSCS
jgi:hypothetical protein